MCLIVVQVYDDDGDGGDDDDDDNGDGDGDRDGESDGHGDREQTPEHLRRPPNLIRNRRFLVSLLIQSFNFWSHARLLGSCHDS